MFCRINDQDVHCHPSDHNDNRIFSCFVIEYDYLYLHGEEWRGHHYFW